MSIKDLVSRWEPVAKLGGWLYVLLGGLVGAAMWVTTIQLSVAANTASIESLREQVKPIEAIRQDVRWIKKRLGGPD
ncbi:MAG TPA: hypothetical protein VHE55_11225 [Fimbriimonadaceae bacterium]|nr:hypothetical protein [Fimbriimonadaceae bacterium]